MLHREIIALFRKELTLEWRQKYAIGGILLYVLSTVFIVYTSFIKVQPNVWNVLFWIMSLFASVNAVVKSFVQESGHRQLYYYTLVNPAALVLSKILYNILLLLLLNVLTFAVFALVAGSPVKDYVLFFVAITLGSFGFSITFTFLSSIAAKASNSATLMAILSFPVVIPILMTLVKLTAGALRLMQDTAIWKDIAILIAIDLILLSLTLVLFPFLWKD